MRRIYMKKLLIAEDDAILRQVIEIILMNEDFELLYASTGSQVLELAGTELPDMIIAKLKLPEVSGLEVIQKLRSEEATAGIPVVLISSNDELLDNKQYREYGASAYLIKPFSPMKFLAQIDLVLKEGQK